MAPPGNRRAGHSRKAQYNTFFGYLAAFAGAVLGGLVLLYSLGNDGAFSGARSTAAGVTSPAARAAAASSSEVKGVFSALGGFFTSGSRVARLEREVAEARVQLAEAAAVREENARLKALLGLAQLEPKPVAMARLIGSTSSSTRRYATLDAGSGKGVQTGMPVRTPLGLVGRVLEVGPTTSRVLLITDAENLVPVKRASDGTPALANGRSDGTLQIRLINIGLNPLKPGDAIVASGSGGLYWPGTAIAVVTELTRDGAIARPLSDPGSAEYVAVQPLWAEQAAVPAPQAQQGRP